MEGPSLYLSAEQLAPFINKKIISVEGSTKIIEKERLANQKILDIFSWGKHLVFQFDDFALRVHFMLYGSFQATIRGVTVTGDYTKKNRVPRLAIKTKIGHIEMYACSLRYIESSNAKSLYDFTTSIMSEEWDSKRALNKILAMPDRQIDDVLLDQTIFSGVGNIIKNEVLFLEKLQPFNIVGNLSLFRLRRLIKQTREFVFHFYEWRKKFELKKHYQIYRRSGCSVCSRKVTKKKTGLSNRWSFYCEKCQKVLK